MGNDQQSYFLIRSLSQDREQSFVWSQTFGTNLRVCEANRDALIEAAKLSFLAYQHGRDENAELKSGSLSAADFDRDWSIEWIQGTNLASDQIAGTLNDDVVGKLAESASNRRIGQQVSRLATSKDTKKRRRFLPRFSLRSFLVLVTIAGALLAVGGRWLAKYQVQHAAMEYLTEHADASISSEASDVPKFISNFLGDAYAMKAVRITCTVNDDETLRYVADLPFLEKLKICGTVKSINSIGRLNNLQELDIRFSQVVDISAVANLKNLTRLDLNASVVDIEPLRKLTKLKHLGMKSSSVSDLSPLRDLKHLEHVEIRYTKVESLTPLANSKELTVVEAAGSAVNDATGLASCPSLQEVDLSSTRISNLDWVRPLNGLTRLGLNNTAVQDLSPLRGKTGIKGLSIPTAHVTDLSPLANCTVDRLTVPDGVTDLSVLSTLIGLRDLTIKNSKATKLPSLANTSLVHLHIDDSAISDLSGLSNCMALTNVTLKRVGAADLSPLASCSELSSLILEEMPVTDLSPLAKLDQFYSLFLTNVPVSDLSPLKSMPRLLRLETEDVPAKDYSVLRQMRQLEQIRIVKLPHDQIPNVSVTNAVGIHLPGSSVTGLDQLPSRIIKRLDLSGSQIKDLAGIEQHRTLGGLNVNDTSVSSLAPVGKLDLGALHARNTQVVDIKPLVNMTELFRLDLSGTPIRDISPMRNFATTQALDVDLSDTKVTNVAPLAGSLDIQSLSVAGTPVVDISPLTQSIVVLDISRTQISDLSSLESVYYLDASNTPVKQLPTQTVYHLDISDTQIRDLTGIAPQMQLLDISHTKVTDLSPLFGHRSLKNLYIEGLDVSETQLLELKQNLPPSCRVHVKAKTSDLVTLGF